MADIDAIEALTTTGLAVRTGTDTWATRSVTTPGDGLTVSNSDGVSGDIAITPDDDLAAVEALGVSGTSEGFAARTGVNSWALRALIQPAAGITVANASGIAGDPTLALADDLAAVEALSAAGIAARTAADTWAVRTIMGTANEIDVTDGDGVGGNPTISLPSTLDLSGSVTSVVDTNFSIKDNADATKVAKFETSALTTGTTRTYGLPDASGTLALSDTTQPASAILASLAATTIGAGSLPIGTSADTLEGLDAGTDGSRLRLVSGLPAWINDSLVGSVNVQVHSISGTYTPSANLIAALVMAIGGGGGGGGALVNAAQMMSVAGGGGGAGSTAISVFTAATIGASKAVTVGLGGSGGIGNAAGGTGGASGLGTTIGDFSLLRADGGNFGTQGVGAAQGIFFGTGGAHVAATTGTAKYSGGGGCDGFGSFNATFGLGTAHGGMGGGSHLGSGARSRTVKSVAANPTASTAAGVAGPTPGAGGSGAAIVYNNATSGTGGAGANGLVVIVEYIAV